jgi:uncharacterized membrane protein YdjX (TVP38/TMEM64 family)
VTPSPGENNAAEAAGAGPPPAAPDDQLQQSARSCSGQQLCHPERSEGEAAPLNYEIPRSARDDSCGRFGREDISLAALVPRTSPRGRIGRIIQFLRRLGPAGPLAVVGTVLPPIGAAFLLGIVAMHAPSFREYPWAPIACVIGFAVLGGCSILPTYAFSIFAGWSFGFAIGLPTAVAGHVGAGLVGIEIARHVSGGRLITMIDERPTWRAVHHALIAGSGGRAVWVILLLRLAPVPPFAVSNLLLGAAHVGRGRFLLGTAIGMTPHAAALVFAAAGLRQMNLKAVEQPWIIVSGIIALLVTVGVIGRLAKRALEDVAHKQEVEEAAGAAPTPCE